MTLIITTMTIIIVIIIIVITGEMSSKYSKLIDEVQPLYYQPITTTTISPAIAHLYSDVHIAAKKVFDNLSESGIIHTSPPDADELELGMMYQIKFHKFQLIYY